MSEFSSGSVCPHVESIARQNCLNLEGCWGKCDIWVHFYLRGVLGLDKLGLLGCCQLHDYVTTNPNLNWQQFSWQACLINDIPEVVMHLYMTCVLCCAKCTLRLSLQQAALLAICIGPGSSTSRLSAPHNWNDIDKIKWQEKRSYIQDMTESIAMIEMMEASLHKVCFDAYCLKASMMLLPWLTYVAALGHNIIAAMTPYVC